MADERRDRYVGQLLQGQESLLQHDIDIINSSKFCIVIALHHNSATLRNFRTAELLQH